MKFDRKKLKAAIKKAESNLDGCDTYPIGAYSLMFNMEKRKALKCGCVKFTIPNSTRLVPWVVNERQILYAIAAEARGRLFITKKWVPLCDATGGRVLLEFTREMQGQLIGDALKEFVLHEPAPAITEAPETAPA